MVRRVTDVESTVDAASDSPTRWYRVIPLLGAVLLVGAVASSGITLVTGGLHLGVLLDFLLVSVPGIVLLYVGIWLPNSFVSPKFYPRIVGWIAGGILVMGIVLALRLLHPGITVELAFGTQAVLLAIGSIAGAGIGVHEARAFTHAEALQERNRRLKETERRLEEAVEELETSNERLEHFAYAASHDLQEPLRMVTTYLKLIEDRYGDELDEDGEEYIDFAVDGADRMREMIDGLLEYSRVDTQGDPLEPVDLDDVLDDVTTDLQFSLEESDAEVTRDPLPTVSGDERQLQQLFQNLLANAIEYSGDEPPRIHVSAESDGEEWIVSVRDEGIGIDVDDPDRIFEIFQRLHSPDEGSGSGIGLALCRRIVERHGGEIWVDSEPGAGSTFSARLPASD